MFCVSNSRYQKPKINIFDMFVTSYNITLLYIFLWPAEYLIFHKNEGIFIATNYVILNDNISKYDITYVCMLHLKRPKTFIHVQ